MGAADKKSKKRKPKRVSKVSGSLATKNNISVSKPEDSTLDTEVNILSTLTFITINTINEMSTEFPETKM